MADTPDLAYAIGLPPADAIEYFRGHGYKVSATALDAWDAARAKAFTVTGIARLDVLADIKGGLLSRLEDGGTYGQFKNELQSVLIKRGWQRIGRGVHADPETGEVGANLPGYRLQNIFRTNMQSAYMAGKYRQMMDQVDVAPYWQYVAVMDSKTRPSHAAMHGKIFRYDDPIWDSHTPPCDYQCRCGLRHLRERDIERRGLTVMRSDGMLEQVEQPVGRETRPATAFVDPTTKTRFVPGPGFGRRPRLEDWGDSALATSLGRRFADAEPAIASRIMQADQRLQLPLTGEYRQWAQSVLRAGRAENTYRVLGVVSPEVVSGLQSQGVALVSAAIAMRDAELLHLTRAAKVARGAALAQDDALALPDLLASASAVLWDTRDPALVYVLRQDGNDADKLIVRVNWAMRIRTTAGRESVTANVVRTAGVVSVRNLMEGNYKLLKGSLEE